MKSNFELKVDQYDIFLEFTKRFSLIEKFIKYAKMLEKFQFLDKRTSCTFLNSEKNE